VVIQLLRDYHFKSLSLYECSFGGNYAEVEIIICWMLNALELET